MNADFGQAERNYRAALRGIQQVQQAYEAALREEREVQRAYEEAIGSRQRHLATLTRDLDD